MRVPGFLLRPLARHLALALAGRREPDVVIGGADHPYLLRWHLIPRNRIANVYVHRFLRSDDDRALHDHPWINLSILLDGAYLEHTPVCRDRLAAARLAEQGITDRRRFTAGALRLRGPRSAHRIELAEGPVWTLFLTGPNVRSWGFWCPRGWRHSRDFTRPGAPGEIGPGCE